MVHGDPKKRGGGSVNIMTLVPFSPPFPSKVTDSDNLFAQTNFTNVFG